MIGVAIRGFLLIGVIGWYSTNMWRTMDGYFRDEFKKFLAKENQNTKFSETYVNINNKLDISRPNAAKENQFVPTEQTSNIKEILECDKIYKDLKKQTEKDGTYSEGKEIQVNVRHIGNPTQKGALQHFDDNANQRPSNLYSTLEDTCMKDDKDNQCG